MIDHNTDVRSVFSWAPKVVTKCESKHWLSCGANRQSVGRAVGVRLQNFLVCVDLLSYGAPPTCVELHLYGKVKNTACSSKQ